MSSDIHRSEQGAESDAVIVSYTEPTRIPEVRPVESGRDPAVLTVTTLVFDFLDFGWIRSRRHVAARLKSLAATYLSHLSDVGPLLKIERAARNPRRFTRCYALETLSRMGESAERSVFTQADALTSADAFVREAAAKALWRMGESAIGVKSHIIDAIYSHWTEGTARYALLWLIRQAEIHQDLELTQDIESALQFVLHAKDSYARDEAKREIDLRAQALNTPAQASGVPQSRTETEPSSEFRKHPSEEHTIRQETTDVLHLMRVAADGTRLNIIRILSRGEQNITALVQALDQTQPALSHHLALLRHSGVILSRRHGKHNYYQLADSGRVLANMISQLQQNEDLPSVPKSLPAVDY